MIRMRMNIAIASRLTSAQRHQLAQTLTSAAVWRIKWVEIRLPDAETADEMMASAAGCRRVDQLPDQATFR